MFYRFLTAFLAGMFFVDCTTVECNPYHEYCCELEGGACDLDADGYFYQYPGDQTTPVDGPVDCDDADATVYPGAPELCDNKDNDCDELIDDDCRPSVR